ncbi:MAG: GNAT family N-acetyltransferase [Pseudomonadota bacterium]|nr:GNAT family N-acetyltransferase [Pseudomonadota bacterium]
MAAQLRLHANAGLPSRSAQSAFNVRAVTADNVEALLLLEVDPGQRGLVGPVPRSLSLAAYQPACRPWALYDGDVPVGLLLLVDLRRHDKKPASELTIWRVMIDARHQRRGLGRQAVAWAVEEARRWGVDAVGLSHQPLPGHAGPFYEKLGFVYTGEVEHDERKMILKLT